MAGSGLVLQFCGRRAFPSELIRCRRAVDGQSELLIRWSLVAVGESGSGGGASEDSVLMWMSQDDAQSCCPDLGPQRPAETRESHRVQDQDQRDLLDLQEDVRSLVSRAQRQMKSVGSGRCASLSHTVAVLSTYAGIAPLAGVFRETGALDLLLELLCDQDRTTRRSAGQMLRALASHDAGSRAVVLLALAQRDLELDFENRFTLLELFAQTTSSEEHICFEHTHLPQIPGKALFSLVKRYLCVTSLVDSAPSDQGPASSSQSGPAPWLRREFEVAMATAALISELVRVLGWDRASVQRESAKSRKSIFKPHTNQSECSIVSLSETSTNSQSERNTNSQSERNIAAQKDFRTSEDFPNQSSYESYLQQQLRPGMRVRMNQDYEEVNTGDEGEFRTSNNGSPPVQVYWCTLGRTYWVHWHMLDIIGSSSELKDQTKDQTKDQKETRLNQTLKLAKDPQVLLLKSSGGLYTCPYLSSGELEEAELNRGDWWELLFFIKKLEPLHQEEVRAILQQGLHRQDVDLDDCALIGLNIPVAVATRLLLFLKQKLPSQCLKELQRCHSFHKLCSETDQDGLTAESALSNPSCSSESSVESVSKKPKTEPEPETDDLLPPEDPSLFPSDMSENLRVFEERLQGKRSVLEKLSETVEILQKELEKRGSGAEQGLQLAAVVFMTRTLDKDSQDRDKNLSNANVRWRLLKLLLELLSSSCELLVGVCLRLICRLLLRFDWRLYFCTEGGVRAVLSAMEHFNSSAVIQQLSLGTLQLLTGAGSSSSLSEGGAHLVREVFASISSATPEGTRGLLGAIPAAIQLLLNHKRSELWVRSGLLVLVWLMSHRELKDGLVSCDLSSVLKQCVSEGVHSGLALSAFNMTSTDPELELQDSQIQTLVSGLKEKVASKEVIQALEKVLCEPQEGAAERLQVTRSRDTFLDLISLMEQHKSDQATLLSLLRILGKFLDSFEEDVLPWHDVIEPLLSLIGNNLSDLEVLQVSVGLLLRLASLEKDFAVLMVRVGAGPVLGRVLDKHSSLQSAADLKDMIQDLDRFSGLYQTLASSVLAGCIQLVLGQIEEHRRSHRPINIPFFDVFLSNLCQGSGVELKEDKCWEKVEVSSNQHRAKNLTDQNQKTFWESNGCTGSHYITIHLLKGVIIRELVVLVSPDDSSYMPARIVVFGGDDPNNVSTELNTVNVAPSATRVVLLQNQTQFWPVVQIRIKRCQQGGIDTRVHGFELLGPKPTFWPVFREQLCLRTHLFYSSKAHTWAQEVRSERSRLLALFNRLNVVLKLEQSFSERFLPDPEAAYALGHTVWEALVTPLVHVITSSECPALSWLLTRYVENAESSRHWKNRAAIFNSRVRRLVHLLVHVDSGPAHNEEPPPPVLTDGGKESKTLSSSGTKPKEKSSSISDMALCWKGVVQQQVQQFLSSHLSQEDFSDSYGGLFQRLQRASDELFQRHSAFVLALRQGFSSALLQLSISRSITVSERFAQYIGHMITQVSSPGAEGEESLEKLQRFLEPTLFLSGLELASSFEHFYRRYLGDRLLLLGNLWLESAVIGQIGACFPERLPQQMLNNLSESRELQRDFSLHRLQQLDLDLDRDLDQEQDLDLDLELDQEQEPDQLDSEPEVLVPVLVLSPRCWSVSSQFYLNQTQLQLFPHNLQNSLSLYVDFYCHYQSVSGSVHSKPRRLQWTWLGRAEVGFGNWTLHVSTLQMFVLLQFNDTEEVSLDSLLDRTGLSEDILLLALQPLTGTEGPLIYSGPDQKPVLRLDPQVAVRSQNSSVHLRLLPAQNYRSVHEDAAAILERKRNFLLCLIVRFMKREREMHIDNLVFKVLDFCQKQDSSGPGPGSGPARFSCSSSDVLSCLMHVVSKNCVRRKQDQPQILEYVPEDLPSPSRGQAQVDYSRDQNETSLVLEDCSLDSGRTMTQDEVRELMKKTVQQVSGALSLEQDWAEHLLVHCLWDVDRVVQRFTDDDEALFLEAGLKVHNAASSGSKENLSSCPVCLNPGSESTPALSCGHYCCQSCWEEYLTSRIEQNLVMSCNCPITDCSAQPTSQFYRSVLRDQDTINKYEAALLRGYVESCLNLTWCTNPSGCDRILLKENLGNAGTCSECRWSSCFNCNFPEAHFPCSCSHMTRWVDDGGFYEGMSVEAQSKHLAKLISKRCPNCSTAIEKNEGCLHMTCAKCSHGFCWRCLKPWKPTHKDYYNCSASVSRAARQGKKFQDFNEKCTFHHQAKDFALGLVRRLSTLTDSVPMRSLSFAMESCRVLVQSRKVLAYSCVYSYYTTVQVQDQDQDQLDLMEQQTEALELHTTALQVLLEETLLQSSDLASSLCLLKPEQFSSGLELIRRVQDRLKAILHHSTQDFRVGYDSRSQSEVAQSSELTNHSEANKESKSDSNQNQDDDDEYDDEYLPEWHEDYDDEDLDEDDYYSDYDEDQDQDYSPYD